MSGFKVIHSYNEFAEAYREIASRSDEAQDFIEHSPRIMSYMGRNVWHSVLDEAKALRVLVENLQFEVRDLKAELDRSEYENTRKMKDSYWENPNPKGWCIYDWS